MAVTKVFNTLSGEKEILEKPKGRPLRLFVCGPTVYDYAHIGNGRTYVAFDLIVSYLRRRGYKIFYLQNITDIDDRIIKKAAEENLTTAQVAKKYTRAYHQDEKGLGISEVNKYAPATQYIRQMVKQIQRLLAKGHAYKIEGDGYYFDITTFPDYGQLAKRTALQAEDSVSRIDESVNKRNKGDFALWKFSKPGEPSWPTPLGDGRPGWHIEDTAITEKYFGPQYDLHGGALDLKFPHHEAEIAQQEAISGKKPMVKIWMHTGFLLVNGEKMSKSVGNFIAIRDFLQKYPASVFRYLVASHHYRSPIDYSDRLVASAASALKTVSEFLAKLQLIKQGRGGTGPGLSPYEEKFFSAMDDDFNTPEALATIFSLINEINPKIWERNRAAAKAIAKWIKNKFNLFKIDVQPAKIPLKIRLLLRRRELFRSNKQFAKSDLLRKEIESLGYLIEDTPAGPLVLKK